MKHIERVGETVFLFLGFPVAILWAVYIHFTPLWKPKNVKPGQAKKP